jgi:hypothetical protein
MWAWSTMVGDVDWETPDPSPRAISGNPNSRAALEDVEDLGEVSDNRQ